MPDSDLDYAKVVGRLALSVGDGSDPGDNPDIIYCDSGTVRITPLINFTRVADATPPFTVGHAAIDATVEPGGYVTWNGQPFVWVVDLTSEKVNPRIPDDAATHKLEFFNVTADGTVVKFPTSTVRFTKDGLDGSGVNDLALVMPVTEGASTPIVRGAQGVGIQSAEVSGGNLLLGLSDGTEIDAGELPVGPGGTDEGVAGYLSTPGTDSEAAVAAKIANGRNIPRTLAKLRNGDPVTIGVIGDSKMDPGTTGNAAGTAVAKLVAELEAWSDSTITVVNEAQSGNTAGSQFLYGAVSAVAAAAPDVTFIELGTNDSNSDANGPWAAGYVKEASWAAIERMAAYLRDAREDAEFVFVGTTPYVPGSASNPKILDYNSGFRSLAATVGAEWVDGYQAFLDYGADWTPLLLDSTHRNDAGNIVLGARLALHFPETGAPVAAALAPRAKIGRYGIGNVNPLAGDLGYYQVSAPGGTPAGTYSVTGTWTVDGNFDVSTVAGSYFEVTGTSVREFLANIDLGSAAVGTAYPVVDLSLDGAVVAANVNLHTQSGKNATNYWLAPFTGLNGNTHTMRVTLKSGMLRVNAVAVLVGGGGDFEPKTEKVFFTPSGAIDLSDGAVKYFVNTTLNLPVGWNSARVEFQGRAPYRATGTTTTTRQSSTVLRVGGVVQSTDYVNIPPVPTAAEVWYASPVSVGAIVDITGNVAVRLEGRAVSTDKTNFFAAAGAWMRAELVRTS